MLTDQRISTFYEDVQRLGLKRPVAAISKETGYSKGNVSLYLSKKLQPSGKFIDRFYEVFKESLKNVPHGTIGKQTAPEELNNNKEAGQPKSLGQVPAEELIQLLKEHNDFLRRNFELSLTGISVQAASILAYVSTSLEKDDEREAGQDEQKLRQLRIDTGKRIGEKMGAGVKSDRKTADR